MRISRARLTKHVSATIKDSRGSYMPIMEINPFSLGLIVLFSFGLYVLIQIVFWVGAKIIVGLRAAKKGHETYLRGPDVLALLLSPPLLILSACLAITIVFGMPSFFALFHP